MSPELARRLARLEIEAGRGQVCPRHDLTIGVRRMKDGMVTVTRELDRRACRWCGQPAVVRWIELEVVLSRAHRPD